MIIGWALGLLSVLIASFSQILSKNKIIGIIMIFIGVIVCQF